MTGHKTAILGIGNPLCCDDGIGIRVIQVLQSQTRYPGADIIDGGTAPDLLSLLDESVERLIIVDALRAGGAPGEIYRLEISDSNIAEQPQALLHGMGVLDSLQLMARLGMKQPKVTLIGIEPFDVAHGLHLSPQMEALLPDIILAVENELNNNILK